MAETTIDLGVFETTVIPDGPPPIVSHVVRGNGIKPGDLVTALCGYRWRVSGQGQRVPCQECEALRGDGWWDA